METGIIVAVMAVIRGYFQGMGTMQEFMHGISQETNFYTWHNFIGRILCRNVKLFSYYIYDC